MMNWRPWTIGISSLALGGLLFFVGYFSLQFSEPILPGLASTGLLVAGFALVAFYSTSGINNLVWSIRASFNEAEFRRLKQLRINGTLAVVPMVIGIALPPVSSALETIRSGISHDAVVIFSIVLTAFGLVLGGLNRAAEFRLLKQSSVRTGHFAS